MIKACVVMHNMIIETRRDYYANKLFDRAKDAVNRGALLDEGYEGKDFIWSRREEISRKRGHAMTQETWPAQALRVDSTMKDELYHRALKRNLLQHNWARQSPLE